MRYLGLDVHSTTTSWCLLDAAGEQLGYGKVATTLPALQALVANVTEADDVTVGQEVGTQSQFVHDVITAKKVKIESFNAQHLRMIASSRKKTDRRDAYWIARALQTGMTPHPVYIPEPKVRRLRQMLALRTSVVRERGRWLVRGRTYLRGMGLQVPSGLRSVAALRGWATSTPSGVEPHTLEMLEMCERQEKSAAQELARLERRLQEEAQGVEAIGRLETIPGIGFIAALTIYAWVGDISRFPNARSLCAYAGLVPAVWQSGDSSRSGRITKQGSPALRGILVQAAHVTWSRCKGPDAEPLRAFADRVQTSRTKRKIAVVALARHLLRIAYYILRDGTTYEPARLRGAPAGASDEAA
jgi:transposase